MLRPFGVSDEVRDYVQKWGVREHVVLQKCRRETRALAHFTMQISPEQGAFMQALAHATNASRVLEVGVFTGYSSTAIALTLKELHGDKAKLVACDISEEYTAKARGYWREAGVDDIIELHLGSAKATLEGLVRDGESFDMMFIDADKTSYGAYYELGISLLRKGGTMLIDNMLWSGRVADPTDHDDSTDALRDLAKRIHADERVTATIATVGDGVGIVVKR